MSICSHLRLSVSLCQIIETYTRVLSASFSYSWFDIPTTYYVIRLFFQVSPDVERNISSIRESNAIWAQAREMEGGSKR